MGTLILASLRAKQSNPESCREYSLDCFGANAPRNDGADCSTASNRIRIRGYRARPDDCQPRRHMHAAPASAEVVVSSKICLDATGRGLRSEPVPVFGTFCLALRRGRDEW